MKKKLDTRFPATRIKKIMQADEDVGKIAMAVPLLVSKALELFLQDLCDQTYEITLKSGAKTVNSLHLKQCVRSFNSFDFLKDTVSKVPDLGGSDGAAEEKSASKKRKISEDEDVNDDDATKRIHMQEAGHVSSTGRGRGRPRGRPKGSRTLEREMVVQHIKSEEAADSPHQNGENEKENTIGPDSIADATYSGPTSNKDEDKLVRNFDLNVGLNVNEDSTSAPTEPSIQPGPDVKHEDSCCWALHDMEKSATGPTEFANLNGGIDEQDEDYDEE